jgi:hypothetical protein
MATIQRTPQVEDVLFKIGPAEQPKDNDIQKGIPTIKGLWEIILRRKSKTKTAADLPDNQTPNKIITTGPYPKAPVSHTQPDEFGRQGSPSPVVTRESILEKLLRMQFTSKLNLKADDEVEFTSGDEKTSCERKLKDLIEYWATTGQTWVYKGNLPLVSLFLVSITRGSNTDGIPYICVRGLQNHKQITYFHAKLSTKSAHAKYHPLKLCYDTSLISKSATEESYSFWADQSDFTLCGNMLQTRVEGRTQLSTIGGVVEVDGLLFILTTGHRFTNIDASFDTPSLTADDLSLEDFDDIVESALVVDADTWKLKTENQSQQAPEVANAVILQRRRKTSNRMELGKPVAQGIDWSLHAIPRTLCRPNGYQTGMTRHYIQGPIEHSPKKKEVTVLSAGSGKIFGTLSSSICYLKFDLATPACICWMIRFKLNDSRYNAS